MRPGITRNGNLKKSYKSGAKKITKLQDDKNDQALYPSKFQANYEHF